ncbi:MAG: hypothetical protein ACO3EE_01770 [Flavobacteriales bacterium]
MITRFWWLLKGYGSTKEKILFLATLALLGIFILTVYLICQMVKGVQEIATDVPLPEDANESLGIEALNEDEQAVTNSYSHAH